LIDASIHVVAPLEIRIRRVQKRENWSREAILSRVRNQMTDEERNSLADYIIVNDDRQALIPQVENWIKIIQFQ
jgi:dephospho-CoA kinase